MRAIIYRRTASATGPDGDRQLAQCRALAASKGWEVTEVFTDQGASAYRRNRPGLDAVMQLVRTRGCDVLVASDISRLTRSAYDLESLISDADASGVAIVTADGIDTSTPEGRLVARYFTAVLVARRASAGR